MKIQPFNWLLGVFNQIRTESILAANTKVRIADAIEGTAKAAVMQFDPKAPISEGQVVLFNDKMYTALEDLPKGKGPDSDKATSWRPGFVVKLEQITDSGGKLVTASVIAELKAKYDAEGAKVVPYATTIKSGQILIATEDDMNAGTATNKAATPFLLKKYIDRLLKGFEDLTWSDVLMSKEGANYVPDIEVLLRILHTPVIQDNNPLSGLGGWVLENEGRSRRLVEADKTKVLAWLGITPGSGGGTVDPTKTVVEFLKIEGPITIDEGNLNTKYTALLKYNDGSTASVVPSTENGFTTSIIGQGEQIFNDGGVPIYSNSVVGDERSFTLRFLFRVPGQPQDTLKTLDVKIIDRSQASNPGLFIGKLWLPFYTDNTLDDFFGLIEGGDCNGGIRVWGVNATYPNQRVNFDILRDGVRVASAEANRSRSDISEVFSIVNTNGHIYGLVWTIPDELKDSVEHTYSVRFSGSTVMLDGDPIKLTCQKPDNPTCPDIALLSTGGTVSASSTFAGSNGGFTVEAAFNGDRTGKTWGQANSPASGWNSGTPNSFPQWVQRDFGKVVSFQELELVSLQDGQPLYAVEPDESTSGVENGLIDFEFQYRLNENDQWSNVPGGHFENNNKVLRRVRLPMQLTARQIRVVVYAARNDYARIIEFIVRPCLTGQADSPVAVKINDAPPFIDEGGNVQLSGVITYADGRRDKATFANSTWLLAAASGDYDTATQTHAAAASGAYLSMVGSLATDLNNVYGDTRNVRVKLLAYGLSDVVTIQVRDKTPEPPQRYITGIQTKSQPKDDYVRGVLLRVRTSGDFRPSVGYNRNRYPDATELGPMSPTNYTGDQYQYREFYQDMSNPDLSVDRFTGPLYITLGFDKTGNLITVKVPDMSVTDPDWVTHL